jgi:hypothetical protein
MNLDYHSQLWLTWSVRFVCVVSALAIYIMVSGCAHKYEVNGTSSGTLTKEPPAADISTTK